MTVATFVSTSSSTVNTELLLFLVSNLSATATTVSAQTISRSNIFDNDDEMAQCWDMLHFTTKDEIAADVSAVLTGINDDLDFLI